MSLIRRSSCVALGLAIVAVGAGPAPAAEFHFTVNQAQSSVHTTSTINAPFSGTFIGNFDATTNPTGTQTRLGLTGGSGNNPVPYTASFATSADSTTTPTGVFSMTVDTGALTASVSGLSADLLGGATISSSLTMNIIYQTFHTVAPGSIYPGGINIPVPLGQATIDTLTAVQTGPASGALTPDGLGGYTFSLLVPADVTIGGTFSAGQAIGPNTFASTLAFTGTLTVSGSTAAVTATAAATGGQTVPGPFEGGSFSAVALDLPTVLPAGNTAHVLFSGDISSLTFDFNVSATLRAAGVSACPGDVNGDNVVNFADLNLMLTAYGSTTGQPNYSPAADLNHDGAVGFDDLNTLLTNYGAAC